ncbi:MAG: ParM/StbA family protein [Chloroflexi bacterium]|nr:ParM/StbA family protein [Chloroflexota bacterium]
MEVIGMLAVDVGYGFVKAAAQDGRRLLFPSAVASAERHGELTTALGLRRPEHHVEVQGTGGRTDRYLVGEAALRAGASRTWSEASTRRDYAILVLTAAALLGADGETRLVVGLPLSAYVQRPERRALRESLLGYGAWVSVDGQDARYLEFTGVTVAPQALAAYLSALRGDPGLAGAEVGVIDVGYRTTDLSLLTPGPDGAAVPDETRSGSLDVGYHDVVDTVRQAVAERAGSIEVPERHVERAMRSGGMLTVRGREMDLRPLVEVAEREVAARIEAEARRLWGADLDFVRAVLVAGGGGQALASHLRLPALRVLPDAAYANAEGFLLLAGAGAMDRAGTQA